MSSLNPHKKQTNTYIEASKHQAVDISQTTFGVNSLWQPYIDWCYENDVNEAFHLIVSTFRLLDPSISEIPFKTILNVLTNDDSLSILKTWAQHDGVCEHIYQLAVKAKTSSNTDLKKLGPISFSAYSNLKVKNTYLLMLFFESDILINEKCHLWVTRLRIWLLVHAIYRTKRHVFLDSNLKTVSGYLISLISKKKIDWTDLLKLETNKEHTKSFSAFDTALKARIEIVNLDNNTKRLKTFSNALSRLAQNEVDSYDANSSDHSQNIYRSIINSISIAEQNLALTESDWYWQNHTPIINIDNKDENFNYAIIDVDNNQSYAHQKLSAASRIISQDEYVYFLPWSWNRLTPYEQQSIEKWINKNLSSIDIHVSFLAALTWIALNTGRSLLRVLDFRVSKDSINKDWTLSLDNFSLKRQSAKKSGSWIPKTDEQYSWVKHRSDLNIITLPHQIKHIFEHPDIKMQLTKAQLIGDLWTCICLESIEVIFSTHMQGSLPRIKSGMLATLLAQKAFNNSNNGNISQLVSSHPQVPLLGAFAYGSWDCDEVHKATTNKHLCKESHQSSNVTAIGSHLNPVDDLLIKAIDAITAKILKIDKNLSPIEFHNAYTAYLVMSLMAGTGIRAVSDVFECIKHFNFKYRFVFINDKASDAGHMGRLTPFPDQCCQILQDIYPKHLQHITNALSELNPKFSIEISRLLDNPTKILPLFFFINPETFDWLQITPSSIDNLGLFNWPLPANLFRQRLVKRLDKAGINQNVINAWLGHKETNLNNYGDYSVQCWLNDLKINRDKFNSVYQQLNFQVLNTFTATPIIHKTKSIKFSTHSFGIKLRAENRRKRREDILQQAQTEIDLLLGNRCISDLKQDELKSLESKIFLTPDKKPHPHALIRSELFNKLLDDAWDDKSIKLKVNKRVFALDDTFTHATDITAQYIDLNQKLRKAFSGLFKSIMPSKVSKMKAPFLVAIAIIFENRICYPRLLMDIYEQKNFRIIRFKKQFYLEYSESLADSNWKSPVQRHLISPVTAALADKLLSGNKKYPVSTEIKLDNALNDILISFNNKVDLSDAYVVIKLLCKIMSEANALELPGNISGFLSGRVPSTSLNWIDWLRLLDDKILLIPAELNQNPSVNLIDNILKSETTRYNLSAIHQTDSLSLMVNAKTFFNEISASLKLYKPAQRIECSKILKTTIKKHQHNVSSSILLIGEWIKHIIDTGKTSKKAFAKSSPSGYFSALSSHMIQLAFDKDFFLMDSEEVTQLYSDFLSSTRELTGTYHADRLKSFIKYCSTKGIEEPDWSELDMPKTTRNVRPGLLTENSYLKALNLITTNANKNNGILLHMAFLLILCFRFGLRSKEAIYLKRQDLVTDENGKVLYLLIKNSLLNELKTVYSKRIVPLLFKLTTDELGVIDRITANYHSSYHDDNRNYLFFSPGHKVTPKIHIIRASLIALLKQTTGNSNFVNHHLRHSFFNIINLALLKLHFPSFKNIINDPDTYKTVREVSLGDSDTEVSLRSNMAAARLMGHTHPRTGFVSYNHFTNIWADTFSSVDYKKSNYTLKNVIDIDQFKRSSAISIKLNEQLIKAYNKPTLTNLIQFLSLISSGLTESRATILLNIDPVVTHELIQKCFQVEHKRNFIPNNYEEWKQSLPLTFEWIKKIPKGAWKRLIELSHSIENNQLPIPNTITTKDKLIELIGANRQLTLWKNYHFSTIQAFIAHFNIPSTLWGAFSYTENNSLFKNHLLDDIPKYPNANRKDLDQGMTTDEPPNPCKYRINLIYQKNSIHQISDSYQLTVCLIAFCMASHVQN